MKNLVKCLASVVLFFAVLQNAFAIDAPTNIQADVETQSMTLSWDQVEGAMFYNIYYSNEPGVDVLTAESNQYEPSNSLEIMDLEANTTYYFILSSIDEQGQESVYTEEMSFTTLGAQNENESVETQETAEENTENSTMNSAEEFQLSQIEVKYQDEVRVTFNAQLDVNQEEDMLFQVTQLEDESQQYFVSGSVVDENDPYTAVLTFEQNLPLDMDYKLVAISVFDIQGRNIESGIESYDNFYVDPETPVRSDEEESSEVETQENQDQEPVEPVVTDPVEVEPTQPEVTDSGALNSADDTQEPIENDVHSAADDQEVLPQTGPTHILMLLVALVFGTMAFVFRFKK